MTSVKPKVFPIIELIQKGTLYLSKAGISNAKLEIEWFLSHLLKCNRIDLYIRFDEPLYNPQIKKLRQFLKRRKAREPFQYIIGLAPFFGRDYIVSPDVLIPRPETELLIELIKKQKNINSCLEVGTGSGCIAITAALEMDGIDIMAIDISSKALTIAKQNSNKYEINNIQFLKMNFLKETPQRQFDIIISNPPYISKKEMFHLKPELSFEPKIALTDNNNGLSFYDRFAEKGDQLLNKGGTMLLEIGHETDIHYLENIFFRRGYSICFHKDLQKIIRVAEISIC